MLLKTILNRVHKIKGYVYGSIQFGTWNRKIVLEIEVHPRRGSQPTCSGCKKKRPGYDALPPRRMEFVPLWGIPVYFLYAMRRVNCPTCGVKVETVPWVDGKHELTTAYQWFLSGWAKRLSWKQVAEAFKTSWYNVFHSVERAVEWGRSQMDLQGITAIGIDEIQWGRGHQYLTLVYQINENCKRLLWIGEHRKVKTVLKFFRWLGEERTARLEFICSDMWKAYLKVIAKKVAQAVHILDRFHIAAHMNKAIDEVRAAEVRSLKAQGKEPILKKSRWCFLKRKENLTEKQEVKLRELVRYNLRTVRSYLLKEEFFFFWEYQSAWWAGVFLDRWCRKVMRSRIDPMKKIAGMLRNHRELILNWFRAKKKFSSGVVEGFNNKAKTTIKMAYGYHTVRGLEIALYHQLGKLPEPKFTHKFF